MRRAFIRGRVTRVDLVVSNLLNMTIHQANCDVIDYLLASNGLAGGSYICIHQMAHERVCTVTLVQLNSLL